VLVGAIDHGFHILPSIQAVFMPVRVAEFVAVVGQVRGLIHCRFLDLLLGYSNRDGFYPTTVCIPVRVKLDRAYLVAALALVSLEDFQIVTFGEL
jgi:hypothetical protein